MRLCSDRGASGGAVQKVHTGDIMEMIREKLVFAGDSRVIMIDNHSVSDPSSDRRQEAVDERSDRGSRNDILLRLDSIPETQSRRFDLFQLVHI